MKKIIKNRGCGKTYNLIKLSHQSGDYIVCHNHREVGRIYKEASRLGLKIPLPLTYQQVINENYRGKNISGFLIDNIEMFLQNLSTVSINAITLNSE